MIISLYCFLYVFKPASNTLTCPGGTPLRLTSTSKLGLACNSTGVGKLILYWGRVIQIPGSPCRVGFSFVICDGKGVYDAVGTAWTKRTTCCTFFNSLSIFLYNFTYFSSYLCNMSLEESSIAPQTRIMSSSVRVASNYGLLACIFFLAKGFFGLTFLFYRVTVPIEGSSSGVSSPPPFSYSPSSPPPCPSSSCSPPPGELDLLSP
jgi:hypothetical protein